MPWNPTYRPRLRPLEAIRLPAEHGSGFAVHDRSGLSEIMLTLSPPALHIMSMMDGSLTCEDIRRCFLESHGQSLSAVTLQTMLDRLDQAHFLEGSSFEAFYQDRLTAYRASGVREMHNEDAYGITESGSVFREMLNGTETLKPNGAIRGLVAPHLDYPRGRPCYAAAYAMLRSQPPPCRIVILGTNHFGRSTTVVATGNDFETPLGRTQTDVAFVEQLERPCGPLRANELDHVREHSVELQVAWLQFLFGAERFRIVPFLCPDPCGPTGLAPYDGNGVDLQTFARSLGTLIAENAESTLIVTGADWSHVGGAFGDQRVLDASFLDEVRARDHSALDRLVAADPQDFVRCLSVDENPTRVCSAGCLYALAAALPDANGTLLAYHQAVDEPTQTCVTCAAVAFT